MDTLGIALHHASHACTDKHSRSKQSAFGHWAEFCQSLGKDALLSDVEGVEAKLSYIMVYGIQYRLKGRTNNPVRSDTVADALGKIASGFTDLG